MRRLKVHLILATLCLIAIKASAQDPLVVLPQAYKLQFENEWVKVTRVHYAPHEKLPAHQHTQTASAYVYLNDGGPVVFKHLDLPYGAVTRPATKAASFRLYQGLKEIHEVENLSDLPSDFLRVEFKTQPVNEKTLRGRFYREASTPDQNFQKVQFENEQIRISRLVFGQGNPILVARNPEEPILLIALTPSSLDVNEKGRSKRLSLETGGTLWIGASQEMRLVNTGVAPVELLRFDFKTKPLSKEVLEEHKKDQHSEK